jgi:hypothetical protein
MRLAVLGGTLLLALAGPATAEVTDRSLAGFQATQKLSIAAPKARVWAAVPNPAAWWNSSHSWSGDAKNLSIDLEKGCFCERLTNGGAVRHLTVVYADGSTLRMFGGLGPLQTTGATGHLAVALKEVAGGTELVLTYDVGGYAKGGLAETWAAPVDAVLGAQVARLKRYVETGKPD